MCQFCTEHGEGKKWYLLMKNYSQELLHEELSARQKAAAQANTRAEYEGRFIDYFLMPAITGVPRPYEEVMTALLPSAPFGLAQGDEAQIVKELQIVHFGQVLPMEEVEKVIDMVDSITRVPCGCRFLTIGKADKRYCFGMAMTGKESPDKVPDASSGLEVLSKEEAKRIIREYDAEGLIHTIWTAITPFIVGVCNCDRDCLAYRVSIEQRGVPSFFRAEYICQTDWELCNGCKLCMSQCQFGAMFYSSALAKVYIDPTRCFGCGVCRAPCPVNGAIKLTPRQEHPQAANIWLKA